MQTTPFQKPSGSPITRAINAGFTLAEMMVAVSIVGIVSGIVAYYYGDFENSFSSNYSRQIFESDLLRTRNEAVSSGARAILSTTSTGYTVGIDYTPYSSTGATDKILFKRTLASNVRITLGQSIIFDTRGYLISTSGNYVNTTCSMTIDGNSFYSKTIYTTGAIQ